MAKISSINGRIIHNSRGTKTIEVDVISDNQYLGRTAAPSGASVGKYEAASFPEGGPEESLRILNENSTVGAYSDFLIHLNNFQEQVHRFYHRSLSPKLGMVIKMKNHKHLVVVK